VAQPDVLEQKIAFDQTDALAIAASAMNREVGRLVAFVYVDASLRPVESAIDEPILELLG